MRDTRIELAPSAPFTTEMRRRSHAAAAIATSNVIPTLWPVIES